MPTLTIDNRSVEVEPGQTLLDAARKLGIDIPTLCWSEQCTPATSCLACLVKIPSQNRLVPACATRAEDGWVVESESAEVRDTRRTALELLLSDHLGDCLSPCHRICPMRLPVPSVIRHIENHRLHEAIALLKTHIALPSVLSRLCNHPCENGCRRGVWDHPAAIRDLERFVADTDLFSPEPFLPARAAASGKSVAIVGAGPTGLTAAYHLARNGHASTLLDRRSAPGGSLRDACDESHLTAELLNAEIGQLERLGLRFESNTDLADPPAWDGLLAKFDAVLIATGPRETRERIPFDLATTPAGLNVDAATYATQRPGVFAAGSVVKPIKQLVRAMSEGLAAAECIHEFLTAGQVRKRVKPLSCVMGRLEDGEIDAFMNGPSPSDRTLPRWGEEAGYNGEEAALEASRCLHCDCRAADSCRLRRYAALYGADPNRYSHPRRKFEQHYQPGQVIFEPGKCIACGLCVQLTERAAEPLGLTFIGRGFNVRIGAPFDHTVAEALTQTAQACVRICPTGALAFRA